MIDLSDQIGDFICQFLLVAFQQIGALLRLFQLPTLFDNLLLGCSRQIDVFVHPCTRLCQLIIGRENVLTQRAKHQFALSNFVFQAMQFVTESPEFTFT